MGLFNRGKKEKKAGCCCGGTPEDVVRSQADRAEAGVKVLGSGCANCIALEQAVREALEELGIKTTVDHVTDFAQIAAYGVMTTPALVVNGRVVSYGKVLKKEEAKALLQQVRG